MKIPAIQFLKAINKKALGNEDPCLGYSIQIYSDGSGRILDPYGKSLNLPFDETDAVKQFKKALKQS